MLSSAHLFCLQKSEAMRIAPEGAEEKYDQNRTLQVHDVTLPTPTARVWWIEHAIMKPSHSSTVCSPPSCIFEKMSVSLLLKQCHYLLVRLIACFTSGWQLFHKNRYQASPVLFISDNMFLAIDPLICENLYLTLAESLIPSIFFSVHLRCQSFHVNTDPIHEYCRVALRSIA